MGTMTSLSIRNSLISVVFVGCLFLSQTVLAGDLAAVRVGSLKFGTVNWELDAISHNKFDEAQGVKVEPLILGNKNATAIALQGGEVDVIVSDWIWVSRQRTAGKNYVFYPYSNAVGGMLVHPDSGIESLTDLKGKKLGIAGGPVDKSWVMYQAWVTQEHGFDLSSQVDAQFGAPPLLNKLMLKGDLDAVITFWKFGAKLQAAGMKSLISIPELLPAFGVDTSMPLLGWVFSEEWANQNPATVDGFLKSSYAAKKLLQESDDEWRRLTPKIKPKSEDELTRLRDTYRAGIPLSFSAEEIAGAKKIYALLAKAGGARLVGKGQELADGTFWVGPGF